MKSIWKLFSGPSPEELEAQGDALSTAGRWGRAKLAYERAQDKLEKKAAPDSERLADLAGKIGMVKESLAQAHRGNASDLIDGGSFQEAHELLSLAMEITADTKFREELRLQLRTVEAQLQKAAQDALPDLHYDLDDAGAEDEAPDEEIGGVSDDEYFHALCATLPAPVQQAYLDYGEAFQAGYVALNAGDFPSAAEHLTRAMAAHPEPDSYIPLELATACMNLGRVDEARALLETFIAHHRDALPAYQLLSEIYWEQAQFGAVEDLLASVPAELAESFAVVMIRGETLCRQGQFAPAGALYQGVLDTYGWNDAVARALAGVHESLGAPVAARRLYQEMISRCTNCRSPVDPTIRHRYAELRFAEGDRQMELLELYLTLAREVPEHAALYFDRISRIYQVLGNNTESARFRVFSDRAEKERAAAASRRDVS